MDESLSGEGGGGGGGDEKLGMSYRPDVTALVDRA